MRRKRKWLVLFGILTGFALNTPCTKSFNSSTHRYVTEYSLQLVSKIDEHDSIMSSDDKKYFDTIADYSLKPDEDEIDGAYKYHFYNPATETNFMGEKDSALTKCNTHYDNAVKAYEEGDKSLAFQELGRAVHFMEDLNTPVHVGYDLMIDAMTKFPLHVEFEKVCDNESKGCKTTVPFESFKYFKTNSIPTIAKCSAVLASGNYYRLNNKVGKKDVSDLAKNAVLNAQYKITGVLYKFFSQVKTVEN